MGDLEKIVFIADYLEPGRKFISGKLRDIIFQYPLMK